MMNDKVSEEVRELVYSDYNNKYEQLKAELQEIEKGCGSFVPYWERNCGQFEDLKHSDHYIYCPTCQAKIEYLKKGISACEELEKEAGVLKHWITCQDLMINDMEKELKQALFQRNQEILEILNKYKNTFCDLCEEDYQKLKKQLTTKEEGKE
jgi:hypothetical protein